ncbi:MAG: hypothetical protein HKO65_19450 [Gemmatimonadetes bacterium]|nr:hypothetical protein [Gemmatimonadota bacterium]NNM07278.1 hypothetical protein [Gemmatimonadota bacterium]
MTDDHVIDIRGYLGGSDPNLDLRAFAVWGGTGHRTRLALPVWRALHLVGGDWGGIVSTPSDHLAPGMDVLFALDLRHDPARRQGAVEALGELAGEDVPFLAFGEDGELSVLLGEHEGRRWFLQVLGGDPEVAIQGRDRETLLFLAGECAGLLFIRELATPLPSPSSTP